jgi:hypothetical protein
MRTPAVARSPATTAALKTSALVPLPVPFQTASRTVPPIATGSVGVPVTNTFSVKFTVTLMELSSPYSPAGAATDAIRGATVSRPDTPTANATRGSSDCTSSRVVHRRTRRRERPGRARRERESSLPSGSSVRRERADMAQASWGTW